MNIFEPIREEFTKLKLQTGLTIGALAIVLVGPCSASAGAVEDWNAIAVQATLASCPSPVCVPAIPARPGATGSLDIAMVQAAVYDAVQAIERQFKPYHVEIPNASGSPVAATAKAAHDVLVNRFPWQAAFLDMTYHQYLANHGGLAEDDPGVTVGAIAAAGIIALRADDGSFPNPPAPDFFGGTDPGVWRPTPPAFAPMLVPWLASVTPFTLKSPSQFRAKAPPLLTSHEYTRDYDEVKALGVLNNSTRTFEQTDLAQFWASNYVVLWNHVLRDIASANVDNIGDSARLFALVDMAFADAGITAWNTKVAYVFWRPITAIRLGDDDGNPRTDGDPTWTPLIVTPPYPDYTSGANTVTGAATRALALFFGTDEMTFDVTTTNPGPTLVDTRTYYRFSDVAEDVVNARIYEGIHFRFADEEARKGGRHVAQWAFSHFLRPLDDE
jgi:hypothetical protein